MIKQPIPIYIQDVFADVVSGVNDKLLAQLQAVNPQITGINYEYGTGWEVIETLTQRTKVRPFDKYPLVILLLDVNEVMNESIGIYSRIPDLRVVIVNGTSPNYKAAERDIKNFKPILTPIYQELLTQMSLICAFQKPGEGFQHDHRRNYFWGRNGLYGKEGNIFEDKLDAIELTFRDLEILSTYCPKKCG